MLYYAIVQEIQSIKFNIKLIFFNIYFISIQNIIIIIIIYLIITLVSCYFYFIYDPNSMKKALMLITNITIHNRRNIFLFYTELKVFISLQASSCGFSIGSAIKKLRLSRWTDNRRLSNILYNPPLQPGHSNDNKQPISSWTRFYLRNIL